MTQIELVKQVAKEQDLTIKKAKNVIEYAIGKMMEEAYTTGKFNFRNIGTFSLRESQPKKCMHPRTGEEITIPAKKRIKFKSSKNFMRKLEKRNS